MLQYMIVNIFLYVGYILIFVSFISLVLFYGKLALSLLPHRLLRL